MAAAQLIDYLENGNIKNSVNYPATYMARSAANRIVVLHENVPTMLAQVLTVLSNDNINIENMVSCSKGNNACSLFDTDAKVSEKAAADTAPFRACAASPSSRADRLRRPPQKIPQTFP